MDAYSRRLLAVYLTFDPPSYRSVMMVLRVCVRRLGRLPQTLVVDGGKEFRSRYFEALLNTYGCHKKYRPWAKPRYGSVIGRLFGTANYAFVHNHWVECITPSYYGQLHGHSEREIALASSELRAQAKLSHTRSPIDAKHLADFLAKIEAHEAVLLQRQRDIENQLVLYRIEHPDATSAQVPRPTIQPPPPKSDTRDPLSSRFASVDLTALQVYEEYR